jgi:hypothetical protein
MELFYLCSFDDEYVKINETTRYIDLEHCINFFEIKINNDKKNQYIITNVMKNTFGKFEQNDTIEISYGSMVSITNISNARIDDTHNIDVHTIVLFKKESIEFYSSEIDNKISELEKLLMETNYDIYSKILDCILEHNNDKKPILK